MAHHGSTSPPRRVLAVDDDPVSTLIIENELPDQFLVDTAHSGEEALERIERVMPDIILLDVI
ncbi:PleD family two-component system response regulator [Thiorhodovibrio frisius]|uniref:Response regulator containing CheY-like receiver domain and AraC-type DNA-binding domain n=1 Tax=Thiorhodovibrio frisius TaxID=631362 RepID=H8Z524_9GAMM|nr:response regulator [Thiorhodovibrio frisius]EIC20431.1 response regulator containing CheY-like receiver domain and AraC-type DNA-binding domain [Thiorhodovibrio frisius]WPL21174.1 Response regulator containing a CheY-like receiver domain and an HD-GYP domain protein [Thiorhodovibrio frisius]